MSPRGSTSRRLRRDPLFVVPALVIAALVVVAVAPDLFAAHDLYDCELSRSLQPPSSTHPFGVDLFGCDYLAKTVHGARSSLAVAFTVVGLTTVSGVLIGAVAGYAGGFVDAVISRATDVWLALPLVLGGIIVLSFFEERGIWHVALVLALFGWPPVVRLTRSTVIEVKHRQYVLAATALGASRRRILLRHILPNSLGPVLVYSTVYLGIVIAAEATLSYLGVGLQLPAQSWGLLLLQAETNFTEAPHLVVFPVLLLTFSVMSFVVMGDVLRRELDPERRAVLA